MHTRRYLHRTVFTFFLLTVHLTILAQTGNEFGYPIAPDLSSSINAPVGKIADEISVSQLGAASYTVDIEIPPGVSGNEPSIKLNYNSQSGNGIAGWGCNLTGLSVITRVPTDIFHDGNAGGISHDMDGPFCLDGQRLIQKGGIQDGDSVFFSPEFSASTLVVLHGLSSSSQSQTWFSIHTQDGNDYEYGHTPNSQQCYSLQNTTKVNAWYVSSVRNPLGGQCNYSYTQFNNCIYPLSVSYGSNFVRFFYETRPDTISTAIEGVPVLVTRRLSSITTGSVINNADSLFRSYTLTYTCDDQTTTSVSRLIRVEVANGRGESLRPTLLNWDFPMAFNCQKVTPSFERSFNFLGTQRSNVSLFAADLNGDGLSDLAQYGYTNQPGGYSFNYPYIQIHYSHLDSSGNVSFRAGNNIILGGSFSINGEWNLVQQTPVAADMDGDGIAELLVPEYYFSPDGSHFALIVGRDGVIHEGEGVKYPDLHVSDIHDILWTMGDYNNDGITEFVVIEKQTDGTNYYGVLMGGFQHIGNPHVAYNKPFRFALPAQPKYLFSTDMDCDGLTDLVVFHSQGYSVIRNTSDWLSDSLPSPYIPQSTHYSLGVNPAYVWAGDFNGDNSPDFLTCTTNSGRFYFELGNGDGSLTQRLACTLNIYDQSVSADDESFFCQILDADGDGKSDVVVHKSMYNLFFNPLHTDSLAQYDRSEVYWLRSDGKRLIVQSHASTNSKIEENARFYTQGDFNGDGLPEVASYSFDCYDGTASSGDTAFRIYRNASFSPSTGKVTGITDGLDKQTQITYSTLANTNIRLQDPGNNIPDFPVIKISAPLNVVSSLETDNGAAGSSQKNYCYGPLLGHVQGRGLLGFNSSRTEDVQTRLVSNYQVTEWHSTALIPSATTETSTLDGLTSTRNTTYSFGSNTHKIYWYNPERIDYHDFDGNFTREQFGYDTYWRIMSMHIINHGFHDYESMEVFDCVEKGGRYIPVDVQYCKYHPDDAGFYVKKCYYTYNDMGLVETETIDADKDVAVTKTYTYDAYGNRLTETVSANGVTPLVNTWQYDDSHRFVVRQTENGLTETLYTHDLWGNVLTETDNTRTAHPLTRTNTYDGWGNLTESVSPQGVRTTYTKGWGSSQAMRYYEVVQGRKQPWTKVWYDAVGREVKTEGINQQGLLTSKTTTYDNKGQVVLIKTQTGDMTVRQASSYDSRGRCISSRLYDTQGTLDQSRTYTYGSNWKSETFNGRTTKHTYDRWGNIASVASPQDTVTYRYYASRLPSSVTACGHTVTMEYDHAGNRTKLTDPDAGTMTYTYDGLGRLKTQRDARNRALAYVYDAYGRVKSGPVGGTIAYNTYGTSSSQKGLLISSRTAGLNKVTYGYDSYGRVITERRSIPGETWLFSYSYDTDGMLAAKTYPDGTVTAFQYDAYGNHISTTIGDTIVWQLTNATGKTAQYLLAGIYQQTETYNVLGQLKSRTLKRNNLRKHGMAFTYDAVTGNLTQRTGMLSSTESFTYDALDRLTQAGNLAMTYSADGNILSKTDIGQYYYEDAKPHAVTSIDNEYFLVSDSVQTVTYNNAGKATLIKEGDSLRISISYGPDGERWKSVLTRNGQSLTTIYLGDYEERRTTQETKSFCYLDGGVMAMREANGPLALYVPYMDNLGSITRIYDGSGTVVFQAAYDAWGNQTVYNNSIGFHRGYCGHEMLPDFGLINMNGRLYDPLLGRFLSTDNFVQEPFDSQNFNRYSYCLNNPLKYTDPSGEFFWVPIIVGALIGGAINLGIKACNGQINSIWDGLVAFGIGSIAGATGGLTGGAAFGLAGGAAAGAGGFIAGMAGGAAGAAASMPIQSLGNHIYFGDPMITGKEFLCGVAVSAVLGGTINGTVARMNGRSFWSGNPKIQMPLQPIEPVAIRSSESNVLQFESQISEEDISRLIAETEALNIPNETPSTYSVYMGRNESGVKYVGITKRNPEIRYGEHLRSNSPRSELNYRAIKGTGNYSSIRAHALEQKLINYFQLQKNGGVLYNQINSIAPAKWQLYNIK